jgi:DNA-binding NarL/FixJ family response regulator
VQNEIKVVIADDHPIFRAGLKQIIESSPRCKVIGDAPDGQSALRMVEELRPDVAVLDINMPSLNGMSVVEQIRQKRLPGEIIFLTMHGEEAMFNRALGLGVKGYVLKDSAVTDIVNSINAVVGGQSFTSPAVTSYLFKRISNRAASNQLPGIADLSLTERKILSLIAEYKTSKEIADELHIHYRTVENYRSSICTKLNLRGSHSLIKFALQHQSEL